MIFITEWYDDNRTASMLQSVLEMPKLKIKHRSFRHFVTDRGKIKAADPNVVEELECNNQWDMRLYEYAKKLTFARFETFIEKGREINKQKKYRELLSKKNRGISQTNLIHN